MNSPKAVEDCHQLILWMVPAIERLPRHRRFTVGERIESSLLEVLELLVEAAYSKERRTVLKMANRRLARVRHLWRLAMELGDIDKRRYSYGASLIDQLGRQAGAWAKGAR